MIHLIISYNLAFECSLGRNFTLRATDFRILEVKLTPSANYVNNRGDTTFRRKLFEQKKVADESAKVIIILEKLFEIGDFIA